MEIVYGGFKFPNLYFIAFSLCILLSELHLDTRLRGFLSIYVHDILQVFLNRKFNYVRFIRPRRYNQKK